MKENEKAKDKAKVEDKGQAELSWIQKVRQFNIREFYKQRRKLVNIVVIALVALIAVAWGGVAFTSRPQFCYTCHEMHTPWNNWAKSVHAEVGCNDCHIKPGVTNLLMHKVVSLKEVYYHLTDSFEKPIKAKELEPVNESCERCHSLKRKFSPSGDLVIPHQKHVEEAKLTCVACHARVVHDPPGKTKPSMSLCLTCHNGKKAPDECDKCHTKKAVPESHQAANWGSTHGALSKTQNCDKCHAWRPDWCKECHQKKPASHVGLWRTTHRDSVAANRAGCTACHTTDFCVRCHGQAI